MRPDAVERSRGKEETIKGTEGCGMATSVGGETRRRNELGSLEHT